jgi:hypothetical protein
MAWVNRHFYYTINAWEKVKVRSDFSSNSTAAEDKGLPEKGYVKITTPSKAVSTENEVVYRVALWEKVLAGENDPYTGSVATTDVVHGPLEIEASGTTIPALQETDKFYIWVKKVEDSGVAEIKGVDYLFGTFYAYTRIVDEKFIEWTVKPKKAGSVKPDFKFQFNPNSGLNDTPNYQTITIKPGMVIPTVQFTKVKTTPSVPNQVKSSMYDIGISIASGASTTWYEWNNCTSRWVKIVRKNITYVTIPAKPNLGSYSYHKYEVWAVYFDKNGTEQKNEAKKLGQEVNRNIKSDAVNPDSKIKNVNETNSPSKQGAEILRLAKACATIAESPETDLPAAKPVIPVDVNEKINPPSHFMTRGVPLTKRAYYNPKGGGTPYELQVYDPTRRQFNPNIDTDTFAASRNNLGLIFQDSDTATALNSPKDKAPYGFRFTYNPTSISYQTAMNTQIDWLLSSNDPANVIGGNTQVSLTLYLNRIADMTELEHLYEKPGSSYGKNYPRTLTDREIQGILHRGTEYDIEFLYRCVNGTPQPSDNGLLTYKVGGSPAITSDFGYITGTPVWIKLHNNLRFKGSLSSISVNHVLFTLDMVPMLSTVDISFIRYPVFGDIPDKQTEAYRTAAKNLKSGSKGADSGE